MRFLDIILVKTMPKFQYFLITFLVFCSNLVLQAQDPRLATQYMQNGEFEKAADVYLKLLERAPANDYYFNNYLECLIQLEQYEEGIKAVKKEISKRPKEGHLYVTYGNLLDRMGNSEEADKQFLKAVENIQADRNTIVKMGNTFTTANKWDLAIQVFERGEQLLPGEKSFSYNLADLYRRKGEEKKMIHYYLNTVDYNASYLETVKSIFQRFLDEDGQLELQTQLYSRIQTNPDNILYPEILSWLFILRKDFKGAFRQLRALDRRFDENGQRIFNLGYVALNESDFEAALEAFSYITREKGVNSPYYLEAQKAYLSTQRKSIADKGGSMEQLKSLETDYQAFLNEFGSNSMTAPIIAELAELQAYYLNDLNAAIETLNTLLGYRAVNRYVLASAKLNLGDFHLMKGDRWEATLLYSQVDKDFGDEILGQEARFRNARLSYYVGDFEWAQTQFDILKSATSRFISNDAIDLSVFIMDNLGLDTTEVPLQMYARAELLVFQNRFQEAFALLDSIRLLFPEHKLEDDILYVEGEIYLKQRKYLEAAAKFQRIADEFPEEIRADNALFMLGDIYEIHLDNPDLARTYFEKIFLDYASSTFAIDARKRYRMLRGDSI
jgi:tetratricopeptide (TPR) repeat protein